ncbi:MAG: HisJ [Firmicutes bacterium]|nr:HisJ [Bacillota bacterium]
MKKLDYIILLCILLLLASGCAKQDTAQMTTINDVANKRIGVCTGTIYDKFAAERFPAATIMHYTEQADLVLAIKSNKIDVAITTLSATKNMLKTNDDVGILTDDVLSIPIGIGFNKSNPALREKFNNFLNASKADGSLNAMYTKWFENDIETIQIPTFKQNPAGKKVILGLSLGDLPNSGVVNGQYTGFDVELIQTFAQKENINLEIAPSDFGALVTSLAAGKVDMIADCIAITAERQKLVDFSEPYMDINSAVIALKKNIATITPADKKETQSSSFFKSAGDSFYSNILHEKRYLLIIDGLKTTGIISIFSVLFGTLLGVLICFLRMSKHKLLKLSAQLYITILRGIPVLVLLMLIYYVIFAKSNIAPILVAIIAFGMNFAAYVSEMFRVTIESIDKGQTEAGIAGGFTKVQTFVYIVMPQAIRLVLPVYKGELISLVKMTSVVGYIAVQDLTKASDIIRSRTFDAFFPLIMTAVLYFAVSWLLVLLLTFVEQKTDPKQKRQTALARRNK